MARRGDPRGPSNAHVRGVHVGGALCHVVPRSAKWGRLVRRFWPVFGTLEYAAGTMDAGWPPNAGEHTKRWESAEQGDLRERPLRAEPTVLRDESVNVVAVGPGDDPELVVEGLEDVREAVEFEFRSVAIAPLALPDRPSWLYPCHTRLTAEEGLRGINGAIRTGRCHSPGRRAAV